MILSIKLYQIIVHQSWNENKHHRWTWKVRNSSSLQSQIIKSNSELKLIKTSHDNIKLKTPYLHITERSVHVKVNIDRVKGVCCAGGTELESPVTVGLVHEWQGPLQHSVWVAVTPVTLGHVQGPTLGTGGIWGLIRR